MKNFKNINKHINSNNIEKYNEITNSYDDYSELVEKYHLGTILFWLIFLIPLSFLFKIIKFLFI